MSTKCRCEQTIMAGTEDGMALEVTVPGGCYRYLMGCPKRIRRPSLDNAIRLNDGSVNDTSNNESL